MANHRFDHPWNFFKTADEDIGTSVLLRVALAITICAVVFQITGMAPTYWIFIDAGSTKIYSGLWSLCTKAQTLSTKFTNSQKAQISILLILCCKSCLSLFRNEYNTFLKTNVSIYVGLIKR